jgi:hypothetical protein
LRPIIVQPGDTFSPPYDLPQLNVVYHGEGSPGRYTFEQISLTRILDQGPLDPMGWQYLVVMDSATGDITAAKKMGLWGHNFSRISDTQYAYYRWPMTRFRRMEDFNMNAGVGQHWGDIVVTDLSFREQQVVRSDSDFFSIDTHAIAIRPNGNLLYLDTAAVPTNSFIGQCAEVCFLLSQVVTEIDGGGNIIRAFDLADYYNPVESLNIMVAEADDFTALDYIHVNSLDVDPRRQHHHLGSPLRRGAQAGWRNRRGHLADGRPAQPEQSVHLHQRSAKRLLTPAHSTNSR